MTDQHDATPGLVPEIFLASVALEPNRWKSGEKRKPSFRLTDFSQEAAQAGFSGWELWEDHYLLADPEEQRRIAGQPLPVRVFNTYVIPGVAQQGALENVTAAIHALSGSVRGVKFNLGSSKDGSDPEAQIAAAAKWAESLPNHVRLFCECHPGTVLELPEAAARAFEVWPQERFGAIVHPVGVGSHSLEGWFEALGNRIEHLHLQARNTDRSLSPLTEMADVIAETRGKLRKLGFRGSVALEFVFGLGQPDESPEKLFRQACEDLAFLRETGW